MTTPDAKLDPFARDPVSGRANVRIGPPAWSETSRGWVITRHKDVVQILNDPAILACNFYELVDQISERSARRFPHLSRLLRTSLPVVADHMVLRRLMAEALRGWSPATLEKLSEKVAGEVWAEAQAMPRFDLVRDFAEKVPPRVMMYVFGLDAYERDRLTELTYGAMRVFNHACSLSVYEKVDRQLGEALPLVSDILKSIREKPRGGALDRLTFAADEMGVDSDTAAACIVFLYIASLDQTGAFIGSAALTLMREPEQCERLRRGEIGWNMAIEELLRFETPAQQATRVASQTTHIAGATIAAGDHLTLLLGAANRDPDAFADPDTLDLGRIGPKHVSFSGGSHACIGAMFARAEAREALRCVVERPPKPIGDQPSWWRMDVSRRLEHLTVATA